ncbi:helix-turn-helix domain-containing protein [Streptomyces sp. G45]|uniref:helix-turn-helix domain-containing protein n=1 Tax=Streptomyces sp. G45 TaxID=3406627 RepID=UPI003C284C8E
MPWPPQNHFFAVRRHLRTPSSPRVPAFTRRASQRDATLTKSYGFQRPDAKTGATMPAPKKLDPTTSLAALYGTKLRRLRQRAGWTQRQLGAQVPIAHSRIAQYELGNEIPTKDVSDILDRLLGANGELSELWWHVQREAIPDWARKYVELEARANVIRKYQAHTVPGLLQTNAYAWALLALAHGGDELEKLVSARLVRQKLLTKPSPPVLWVILDEAVLRRPVGGATVMRGQLAHLLRTVEEFGRVTVQVLPFEQGEHLLMGGSATVLSFPRRPDVAYLEGPQSGELVERGDSVTEYALAFEHLVARALRPEESVDLIRSVMEGLHRDAHVPTRPQRRRLAQVQLQQPGGWRLRRGR